MSKYPTGLHPGPQIRYIPKAKVVTNDAEDAILLASGYGLIPDLWQAAIISDWMGRRRDGKWCAGKCGLSIPRQNGKNGALEVRELFGMIVLGEAFLHTAHEVKTARKAFKRLKHFFGEKADDPDAKFPELNDLVADVRNTNGQEAIFLKDLWAVDGREVRSTGRPRDEYGDHILDATFIAKGGSIEIAARSSGSGRGWTVDVLVLDEAQHLNDDEIEALLSTVSSAPLKNPQVIFMGTPPNPEKGQTGEVFRRVRGLIKKKDKRLSWVEYGFGNGPMPEIDDATALWWYNPALGSRLQMDVIDDERSILSEAGYARERFGWWGEGDGKGGSIFGANWLGCAIKALKPAARPEISGFGIGVSRGMEWATIAESRVMDDGRILVGVTTRHVGTGWIPAEARRLQDKYAVTFALPEDCPDPNLAEALEDEGVDVVTLPRVEWVEAISAFYQEVRDGSIAHEQVKELDDAVDAAEWKPGDRLNVSRAKSGSDVDALEAGIGAHHSATELAYDIADSLG